MHTFNYYIKQLLQMLRERHTTQLCLNAGKKQSVRCKIALSPSYNESEHTYHTFQVMGLTSNIIVNNS